MWRSFPGVLGRLGGRVAAFATGKIRAEIEVDGDRINDLHLWRLGPGHLGAIVSVTINTAVLICSSLTMAMAVHSIKLGKRGLLVFFLLLTLLIGAAFLSIKFHEYAGHYRMHEVPGPNFHFPGPQERHVQLFFSAYFLMTGLHALHMIIGEALLCTLVLLSLSGRFTAQHHQPVELSGLYWHFVDIVWIFLFPLLYLIEK